MLLYKSMFPRFKILYSFFAVATIFCTSTTASLLAQSRSAYGNAVIGSDHENKRPMLEALENSYSSIMIDLSLDKNGVITAGKVNFEKDYLRNIKRLLPAKNGWLFDQPDELVMIVNLKDDPLKMWDPFCKIIDQYQELFTQFNDGVRKKGAVRLVIAGRLPEQKLIEAAPSWYGFMFSINEESKYSSWRNPIVGFEYKKFFKWKGDGYMPNPEYHSLLSYAKNMHKANKQIMLLNAPAGKNFWSIVLGAGVDWIEVNDMVVYADFVKNRYK